MSDDPLLPERYRDAGLLGEGGMGEVRRVVDTLLDRTVALKILHADTPGSEVVLARFLREARITARLEHPGIIPVYDVGYLSDGRVYFTMKVIRGRTLGTMIESVHAASADRWRSTDDGWTLRRLIDTFYRACQAIASAHVRRIVHRDLKPENIMVGPFGEIMVLDWGLARDLTVDDGDTPASPLAPTHVATTRNDVIQGTLRYMAPEQAMAANDRLGPQADVYSLGCILYEILTGSPPHRITSPEQLLIAALKGPPTPALLVRPGERARTGRGIPIDLWRICEKALSFPVGERPLDASALAKQLRDWLAGARRQEEARALVEQADALRARVAGLRLAGQRRRREASEASREISPLAPVSERRSIWSMEDDAESLEAEAAQVERTLLQALRSALQQAPGLPAAHRILAEHYHARHAAAEAVGDQAAAARFEAQLAEHDDGRFADWLHGDGQLSLTSEPPGAFAVLHRFVQRDRRLHCEPLTVLGSTPIVGLNIPRGSYLLTLRSPGCAEVRYPVQIGRGEHWEGTVRLPSEALAGEDVIVPAGWCQIGGDADAIGSLPRQHTWIPDFAIQRVPVTNTRYIAFLDALVDAGRAEEAQRYVPRERSVRSGRAGAMLYGRRDDGSFCLIPNAEGNMWQPEWPVLMVTWHAAAAYARWCAERDGLPWRLPGELEWEKAARGVDGRTYPWGDFLDLTWCCVLASHAGRQVPASVDAHPGDISPYGVLGMGGNARDWCAEPFSVEGPTAPVPEPQQPGDPDTMRVARGGAWYSASREARVCTRIRAPQGLNRGGIGIRLVRSL